MNKKVEMSRFGNFVTGMKDVLNPHSIIEDFSQLNVVDWGLMTVLLLTQIGVFVYIGDYSMMGWIGVITGVSTIISLILVNKGLSTNYIFGAIGSLVWLIIALQHMLIGDVVTQSFYFIMQFVGIAVWTKIKNEESSDHIIARRMTMRTTIITIVSVITLYFIVLFSSSKLGGSQVILDSALLPLGVVGQILMTYGYRSQWGAWITINVINVVIWYNQIAVDPSAISMLVLQIVMLVNSIYGAYQWMKDSE